MMDERNGWILIADVTLVNTAPRIVTVGVDRHRTLFRQHNSRSVDALLEILPETFTMSLPYLKLAWAQSTLPWHSCFWRPAGRMTGTNGVVESLFRLGHLHSTTTTNPPAISKVLVANRGEIACRVIRTCQRLGIPTVAVYSVADGPGALHAQMADEAVCIGDGPSPADSYLRQNELIDICAQHQVHAIHPGYGFLSENADFSEKVAKAGHIFIGPPASAIHQMGSKSASKAIMDAAKVPTTPGYYEAATSETNREPQDAERLRHEANRIGYPVLIKAVAGGGGKGMRIVEKDKDFLAMLQACQREARNAFGDDRVLLEKYLVRPRHIEVQIVADTHGNVVSLHERDCSLQRRHQKIIEEAPASDLDPLLRQELGAMARKAAQAVGYVNAGTVEFLLDTAPDNLGQFYFCEMNTRLQVEHPITEEITGVDLVEWQLRVAAGEELPIKDSQDIPCIGHAFEARIYAENPARNFLPATGRVWHHAPPASLNTGLSPDSHVRVDTCIQSPMDISVYYDPMISKLIVHGENRAVALQKLIGALKNYQIAGVPSNIDFLIKCAKHPIFAQAGAMNTGFLEDYADDVQVLERTTPPALAQAVGAWAVMMHLEGRRGPAPPTSTSPWSSYQGSWRIGGQSGRATRTLQLQDVPDSAIKCISNRDGSFDVHVGGEHDQSFHVTGVFGSDTSMQVVVNHSQRIRVSTALKEEHDSIHVLMWPEQSPDYSWEVVLKHPYAPSTLEAVAGTVGEGTVKAPMPGKISRIEKREGEDVTEGDVVMVLEAMKMEHSIRSTISGKVEEVLFGEGDIVSDGAILMQVRSHKD